MSRLVSFIVLIAVILSVAVVFFLVMRQFLVPMFLAAVLVVIFRPLHKWFEIKLPGRRRLTAGATTLCIVLAVLVPLLALGWNAYLEVAGFAKNVADDGGKELNKQINATIEEVTQYLRSKGIHITQYLQADDDSSPASSVRAFVDEKIQGWANAQGGAAALTGAQWLLGTIVRLAVGLAILIISIYFFLLDGPGMLVAIMHLSPLDDRYELELLQKFSNISRAVVVATLLSAFVQGVLAGIGYYVAGTGAIFSLTILTMVLAMIPFLGAAAVWLPVSIWLFFQGSVSAAILLGLYGTFVVSLSDNVIKPLVLHGQSNLHPLLALLSVLGGVVALGPIGILVGPMAVAFLQALLDMLRREIHEMGESDADPSDDVQISTEASDFAATSEGGPSRESSREGASGGSSPKKTSESRPPPSRAGKDGARGRRTRSKRANKRRKRS